MGRDILSRTREDELVFRATCKGRTGSTIGERTRGGGGSTLRGLFRGGHCRGRCRTTERDGGMGSTTVASTRGFARGTGSTIGVITTRGQKVFTAMTIFTLVFILVTTDFADYATSLRKTSSTVVSADCSDASRSVCTTRGTCHTLRRTLGARVGRVRSARPSCSRCQCRVSRVNRGPCRLVSCLAMGCNNFACSRITRRVGRVFQRRCKVAASSAERAIARAGAIQMKRSLKLIIADKCYGYPVYYNR